MTDNEAIDKIAQLVRLDEDGTWTDADGILESIGYAIQATGRTIEGWE